MNLFNAGKPSSEIRREYDLTPLSFNNWIKQSHNIQSFKPYDNITDEQKELIELKKEINILRWKMKF